MGRRVELGLIIFANSRKEGKRIGKDCESSSCGERKREHSGWS